ncbi:hypothetical protein BDY24DRAFT_399561 [Mrakia frigida]|uniref:uncharacterized protein n=1 Tax=Mrakia frigida TaxID=29902 RepID=UPI003FCC21BE
MSERWRWCRRLQGDLGLEEGGDGSNPDEDQLGIWWKGRETKGRVRTKRGGKTETGD